MKQMKSKTFVVLMLCAFMAATGLLAGLNYFANSKWGKNIKSDWKTGQIWGSDPYILVEYKANYISQNNLPYNAFLFGGSKSGVVQPSNLNRHTGNVFYNYWTNGGCFENYELFSNYILKEYADIKEIIICLSSHEVEHYKAGWKIIPSKMKNQPFSSLSVIGTILKGKYLNANAFVDLYKERNTENLEPLTHADGSRDCSLYLAKRDENPKQYIAERVLPSWHPDDGGWKKNLADLFYAQKILPACDENIAALRRIKARIEARNIKLTVIIMPTFVGEIHKYCSPQFIQYLKDLVLIADIWNFSGINGIDLNPYNFSDGGHCFDFVADKMIESVYSDGTPNTTDMDAFGILLTPGNIDAYIESQRQKWLVLKAEYDATGTITLQSKIDASYLGE